eukprot:4419047-Pleurochrysis_carterae.AAC.1
MTAFDKYSRVCECVRACERETRQNLHLSLFADVVVPVDLRSIQKSMGDCKRAKGNSHMYNQLAAQAHASC